MNVIEPDAHGRTPLSYLVADCSVTEGKLDIFIPAFKADTLYYRDSLTFHYAIMNQNLPVSILKRLLPGKGKIINDVNKKGQTVLHCAVAELRKINILSNNATRLVQIIFQLLNNKNVDIDAIDESAETACHYLARFSTQPAGVMADLLLHSSSIDDVNKDKETALELALKHSDWSHSSTTEAVEILIAKSNFTKSLESSDILHQAISNFRDQKCKHIVSSLLNKNMDPNRKDKYGLTPLYYALRWQSTDTIQLLINGGAVLSSLDKDGACMLHHASSRPEQAKETIELLLDAGLKINQKDNEGRRPVHFAARSGNLWTLKILENEGAFLSSTDNKGNSVLHYSVLNERYYKEIIEYLIGSKAVHIDHRNVFDKTPLLDAVNTGHVSAVEVLLSLGANLAIRDAQLFTPLHYAAQYRSPSDLVSLLIDNGAEIDAQNEEGETALHLALKYEKPLLSVICVLLRANASAAIMNKNGERSLDVLSKGGRTLLHHAAEQNSQETLELALNWGAPTGAKDVTGGHPFITPLSMGVLRS